MSSYDKEPRRCLFVPESGSPDCLRPALDGELWCAAHNTPVKRRAARRDASCACNGCCADTDYRTREELIQEGWVWVRNCWTCPECVKEFAAEQQAAYDDEWRAA